MTGCQLASFPTHTHTHTHTALGAALGPSSWVFQYLLRQLSPNWKKATACCPPASQTADKHQATKDLSIISTMRERTRRPHFAVRRNRHTCSLHTALWWWMFASVCVCVCVCVCVKPCVTSAECGVNVRLDDFWLDVSQIEVNAAAHDDDSYQPPCFLLTEAPLSSASCVLWHRKTQRYFTHCAAVSLWLEKKPLPLKKKMHCGQ